MKKFKFNLKETMIASMIPQSNRPEQSIKGYKVDLTKLEKKYPNLKIKKKKIEEK